MRAVVRAMRCALLTRGWEQARHTPRFDAVTGDEYRSPLHGPAGTTRGATDAGSGSSNACTKWRSPRLCGFVTGPLSRSARRGASAHCRRTLKNLRYGWWGMRSRLRQWKAPACTGERHRTGRAKPGSRRNCCMRNMLSNCAVAGRISRTAAGWRGYAGSGWAARAWRRIAPSLRCARSAAIGAAWSSSARGCATGCRR